MAKDDYGTATVGGGLKFKGVKGGGVEKKKKKMKKHAKHDDKVEEALMKTREQTKASSEDAEEGNVHKDDQLKLAIAEETSGPSTSRKTEAEKKHEELRRKRVSLTLLRHTEAEWLTELTAG